jgi:DNA-binding PadR family transcriptional regulator
VPINPLFGTVRLAACVHLLPTSFLGLVLMNNKTLYLALKHFEEIRAVTRQVILQEGKPNRHLYELTERGIELLQAY